MGYILKQYLITFGWALTGAISMAFALGILAKVFSWLTPIDEWEELKKGNYAVAIVFGATILGAAFVIAHIVTG
ncbi:MAG: DUF350 domain-containing protein [Patescibacteria group bacterium]|jgi:uncharacterized membrane protein YjfL (UPF0719 family)